MSLEKRYYLEGEEYRRVILVNKIWRAVFAGSLTTETRPAHDRQLLRQIGLSIGPRQPRQIIRRTFEVLRVKCCKIFTKIATFREIKNKSNFSKTINRAQNSRFRRNSMKTEFSKASLLKQ